MVWLLVALGLVILLLAGDALVKGAVNLSLRVGVPALIVSLTIVAFGTSAPELLIAIQALLMDSPGIALGNVVGSNTANILLVLGIPALISPLHTAGCDTRKTYVFMILATLLFIGLALGGVFTLWSGLVLLGALGLVLWDAFREAKSHRRDGKAQAAQAAEAAAVAAAARADAEARREAAGETAEEDAYEDEIEVEGADPDMPWWKIGLYLVLGLVGLPLGADLLVDNATIIARMFDVSDSVIGLTLVAVGTSLPELATTVMAAIRRQADVALGNVIGSNMFNLLAIIGVATFIGPVPVDPEFLQFDLWVMLAASLLLAPFVLLKWNIGRRWGLGLTALYFLYGYVVIF